MNQMGSMLKKLGDMQKRMEAAQKEISTMSFEGAAASGLVKVQIDGNGVVKRVTFDESLKGEPLDMLGDLVVTAFNSANDEKETVTKKKLSGLASGLMPFGMKLPGFPG